MCSQSKLAQLQIRVSRDQKAEIARSAREAGLSMSDYVMRKVLPDNQHRFLQLLKDLAKTGNARFVLAELNDLLTGLGREDLKITVSQYSVVGLSDYLENYVAAMVELACVKADTDPPGWTAGIAPLKAPVFGADLLSLRLHLLRASPPPFRNRNIFIDTSIGGRV